MWRIYFNPFAMFVARYEKFETDFWFRSNSYLVNILLRFDLSYLNRFDIVNEQNFNLDLHSRFFKFLNPKISILFMRLLYSGKIPFCKISDLWYDLLILVLLLDKASIFLSQKKCRQLCFLV